MKILFPVVDNEQNKEVLASGFLETNDVRVFDSDTFSFQHLRTDELGKNMQSLPVALKEHEIDTIISTQMRPLALQIFNNYGVKVYAARGTDVNENLALFRDGYLNPYSIESSRELLACSGTCSSCSSVTCN